MKLKCCELQRIRLTVQCTTAKVEYLMSYGEASEKGNGAVTDSNKLVFSIKSKQISH